MSQPSGWQLSGSASEAYERYIVQAFMQGWANALRVSPDPAIRVLSGRSGEPLLREAPSIVGPTPSLMS